MSILKNRTVLGLVCIVLSLIICFGLTPLFNDAVKAQVEIVRIVRNVNKGEIITEDMVTLVKIGGHNLPTNVLKEKENVVGQYAKYDLLTGDYVLSDKLSETPLTEFVYLHELDGTHQAMSITIKSFAAGLSGKLEAGDIVSLIASEVGDFRETVAPPELQYVRVIAVTDSNGNDKGYTENNSDEEELPSSITLLVVPVQARLLAEFETTGRIHCTLVYRGMEENSNKFLQTQADYLKSLENDTTKSTDTAEVDTETETELNPETPSTDVQDEQEVIPDEQ